MKTGSFYSLLKDDIPGAISIARGKFKLYDVNLSYVELAPRWDLLKSYKDKVIGESGYKDDFSRYLDTLDPHKVYDELVRLAGDSEPVLLCHCGVNSFCHRHLIARWLEDSLGITIEEYGKGLVDRSNGRIVW